MPLQIVEDGSPVSLTGGRIIPRCGSNDPGGGTPPGSTEKGENVRIPTVGDGFPVPLAGGRIIPRCGINDPGGGTPPLREKGENVRIQGRSNAAISLDHPFAGIIFDIFPNFLIIPGIPDHMVIIRALKYSFSDFFCGKCFDGTHNTRNPV